MEWGSFKTSAPAAGAGMMVIWIVHDHVGPAGSGGRTVQVGEPLGLCHGDSAFPPGFHSVGAEAKDLEPEGRLELLRCIEVPIRQRRVYHRSPTSAP